MLLQKQERNQKILLILWSLNSKMRGKNLVWIMIDLSELQIKIMRRLFLKLYRKFMIKEIFILENMRDFIVLHVKHIILKKIWKKGFAQYIRQKQNLLRKKVIFSNSQNIKRNFWN